MKDYVRLPEFVGYFGYPCALKVVHVSNPTYTDNGYLIDCDEKSERIDFATAKELEVFAAEHDLVAECDSTDGTSWTDEEDGVYVVRAYERSAIGRQVEDDKFNGGSTVEGSFYVYTTLECDPEDLTDEAQEAYDEWFEEMVVTVDGENRFLHFTEEELFDLYEKYRDRIWNPDGTPRVA
jgi:hypothetical protein